MAEFFLFILMVVVFFAWLHHKTGVFEKLEVGNSQLSHEEWQKELDDNLNNDPNFPGSYFYSLHQQLSHKDDHVD